MNLRASLIELWTRVNDYVVSEKIFKNGYNDQYSQEMEAVISNSPTGVRARGTFAKYIAGDSLTMDPEMDDFTSLWDVVVSMGHHIATYGGVWIHRSIKIDKSGNFVTAKIKVLNYHKCRIGKKDDNENDGKVHYGDFSSKKGLIGSSSTKKWFYSFNDNQNVIRDQILVDAKDAGVDSIEEALAYYRGQVMYINTTPDHVYAISPFDSVFNDLDTEYRISLYSNKSFRSGFLGKLMVFYSGLSKEDGENLNNDIQKWLGAENSDSVYLAEVDNAEDVEKSIFIKQIPTEYDDDMATNTEKRISVNILGAASNLPSALLYSNDTSLFGGSGELINALKKFYSEQTSPYRAIIEKNLRRLGYDTKINPLGE